MKDVDRYDPEVRELRVRPHNERELELHFRYTSAGILLLAGLIYLLLTVYWWVFG